MVYWTRNAALKSLILLMIFFIATALLLARPYMSRNAYWLKLSGKGSACEWGSISEMNARSRRMASLEQEFIRTSRLLKRDPSGINHWLTPRGSYWVPAGSDAPNSEFRLPFRELAEQEVAIYGTGAQSVRPGDTVLDCGANIGAYTRTALAAGAQLVVAIEPAPENLACLRRNLAEEINAGRVILYGKGVWDKDDILSLNILPTTSAGDSFLPRADATRTVRVPVTTIDKIVSELHLQRVDFIKMDIEGAENRALLGAIGTLRKYEPRMAIAPEHFLGEEDVITATVRNLGLYSTIELGPCEMNPAGFLTHESLFFR